MDAVDTDAISVHDFSEKILEQVVHFHVMKMKGGFFLWIGATPNLSNLAVSMSSKYDSMPLSTLLLGDPSDTAPNALAQRLGLNVQVMHNQQGHFADFVAKRPGRTHDAYIWSSFGVCQMAKDGVFAGGWETAAKKTKKQVFVSYSLPSTDSNHMLLVENRIKKEMEQFPDKF